MGFHTNAFHPFSCKCIIEFSFDDSLPDDQIVTTPHRTLNHCEYHQNLAGDIHAHHEAVYDECRHAGAVVLSVEEAFKSRPSISWGDKRELNIHLPDTVDKKAVAAHVKTTFPGKRIKVN